MFRGLGEAQGYMFVKALVAQATTDRFSECILEPLAERNVVPFDLPD